VPAGEPAAGRWPRPCLPGAAARTKFREARRGRAVPNANPLPAFPMRSDDLLPLLRHMEWADAPVWRAVLALPAPAAAEWSDAAVAAR
jgi:hypothetical protein